MARRDEGAYPPEVCDRGATKPAGLFLENPSGDGSFGLGLCWLGRYSPLRGCTGLAALAQPKIPRRRTPSNFQTGSEAEFGRNRRHANPRKGGTYNQVRLHSAIANITPADRLACRQAAIWTERHRKLAEAREARRRKRAGETKSDLATGKAAVADPTSTISPEDRATQGCGPSAAGNSSIAGFGGGNAAQVGHLRDRSQSDNSQGAWGTESPKGTPPNSTINRDGESAWSKLPNDDSR